MNDVSLLLTALAAAFFVFVHLAAGRLRFLNGRPRSRWLSVAGGVSVTYVFVHLLPELSDAQEQFDGWLAVLDHHIYLIALLGLVVFYGLERLALQSRARGEGADDGTSPSVFWLHIASFALYNGIIGYLLLHREEQNMLGLLWYVLAMALHFVVVDFGLRDHHKQRYHTRGRWVLAAAVVSGWVLGWLTRINPILLLALFAFIAGGVVLNVLKEELPEERQSRFGAFVLGCLIYAVLLQIPG